jgi:hypothetical protein
MTKMIYCYCPKCQKQAHNYIREGAKEWLQIYCLDCNIKFKVNIKDFSK